MADVPILLKCTACGATEERTASPQDFRVSRGLFVPVSCYACGARCAEPTWRPWDLTHNDRQFLKGLRIASDRGTTHDDRPE